MKLNIFNKLKNDLISTIDEKLGFSKPRLTIYDSIEKKQIVIQPKVLKISQSGNADVSKIPIQFNKQDKFASVADNVVVSGNSYNLTIFETDSFSVTDIFFNKSIENIIFIGLLKFKTYSKFYISSR